MGLQKEVLVPLKISLSHEMRLSPSLPLKQSTLGGIRRLGISTGEDLSPF
jgi:hypothetical protein